MRAQRLSARLFTSSRGRRQIARGPFAPALVGVAVALTLSGLSIRLSAHATILTGRTAIAVFNGGVIERSIDDGATWTVVHSGTTADLRRGACTTPKICYTVGSSGVILQTMDAGQTWQPQHSGTTSGFKDIAFSDASHGLIVGTSGVILTTVDGGSHWVKQHSGTGVTLRNAALRTANGLQYGYAVGDNGVIIASTNATDVNATWFPQKSGTTTSFNGVEFVDAKTGGAVGENGLIETTSDGGATWTKQPSGTTHGLKELAAPDSTRWFAVGTASTIIASSDGGKTWSNQPSAVSGNLLAMGFPDGDASHGVANGYDGIQEVTTDGIHWVAVQSHTTQVGYGVMWTTLV